MSEELEALRKYRNKCLDKSDWAVVFDESLSTVRKQVENIQTRIEGHNKSRSKLAGMLDRCRVKF